jgi:hypothetical protein
MNNFHPNLPSRGAGQHLAIAASIFVVGIILYTGVLIIYRLYFHPLAEFPGPFFNSVSDVSKRIFEK